jgi:hypothetical protein
MEAQKEEDKSLSDIDNENCSSQSNSNGQSKHQNLVVKRNLQIASVSPTSHKVQFAVDEHQDDSIADCQSSGAVTDEEVRNGPMP